MLGIDVEVVLVAEDALAVIPRTARLDTLLPAPGLAPVRGDLAVRETAFLLKAVALKGHQADGTSMIYPPLGLDALTCAMSAPLSVHPVGHVEKCASSRDQGIIKESMAAALPRSERVSVE